jgi:type VI secretion system FHA domain protein
MLILSVLRCPDAVPPETKRVTGGEFKIGRGPDNDWIMPDPDRMLSKRHCVVAFRNGGWAIADTSTNGTFLNRDAEPIGAGQIRALADGDRIRFGAYEIEVRVEEEQGYAATRGGAFGGGAKASPFDDPFGDDVFAAKPPPQESFTSSAFGNDPLFGGPPPQQSVTMPARYDALAPNISDDDFFAAPTQPDHSQSFSDAFRPPPVAPSLIPDDDWDLGFPSAKPEPVAPAAPPMPLPSVAPQAFAQPAAPPVQPAYAPPAQPAYAPPAQPAYAPPAQPAYAPPAQAASAPPQRLGEPLGFGQPAAPAYPQPVAPAQMPSPAPQAYQPVVQPLVPPSAPQADPFAMPGLPQAVPQAFGQPAAAQPDPFATPGMPQAVPQPFGFPEPDAAPQAFGQPVAPSSAPVAPMPSPGPAAGLSPFAEPSDFATATPSLRPAVAPIAAPAAAPVAAPPMVQTPPPAAAAPGSDALLAAFMEGAGMGAAKPEDAVATMRALGAAFRATVSGIRQALIARSSIKGEFRIEQTMIRARGNNPLKFSADDDDALSAMLGVGRRTDVKPDAAIADALRDMRLHELATMAAMQEAVRAMLGLLDPVKLRAEADAAGGMSVLPAQKKAKAFEAYEKLHDKVTRALADDFDSVFGKSFARAYETALRDISAKDR